MRCFSRRRHRQKLNGRGVFALCLLTVLVLFGLAEWRIHSVFEEVTYNYACQMITDAVNEAVAEKVLKGEKRIDYRPADDLQPEFEALKAEVIAKGYYTQDEDVLSYASFPEVAENFFKWRKAKNEGVDAGLAEGGVYPV